MSFVIDKILSIVKPIKEGFTSHSGNPRKTPDLYQILVHVLKLLVILFLAYTTFFLKRVKNNPVSEIIF